MKAFLFRHIPLGIACLSAASVCVLFMRAYPYIIAEPDSLGYLWQAKSFSIFAPLAIDFQRPPLFALLLRATLMFPDSGTALYRLHMLLFVLSICTSYYTASAVFRSRWWGLGLALTHLLIEVITLRTLFYGVEMLSDALFAHLLFIGTLLTIVSYVNNAVRLRGAGLFLLGCTILVRPIGIAVIVPWLIFLCAEYFLTNSRPMISRVKTTCVFLAILLLPSVSWYARNAAFGNQFHGNELKGIHALYSVIRLADAESFSDNPELSVRSAELNAQGADDGEKTHALMEFRLEQIGKPIIEKSDLYMIDASRVGLELAWDVIRTHPEQLIGVFFHNYVQLLSLNVIATKDFIRFEADVQKKYDQILAKNFNAKSLQEIYSSAVLSDVAYDHAIADALYFLCCSNALIVALHSNFSVALIIVFHLWFVVCVAAYVHMRRKMSEGDDVVMRNVFGVIGVLLFQTMLYLMINAMVTQAVPRLALPVSMTLHIAIAFMFIAALRHMFGAFQITFKDGILYALDAFVVVFRFDVVRASYAVTLGRLRCPAILKNGQTFSCDPLHCLSCHSIFSHGIYEEHVAAVLERILKRGMTFLDAGASAGYFTIVASRLVGNGGRVFAFEPSQHALMLLRENIRSNALANVQVEPMALAERTGEMHFHTSPLSAFSSASFTNARSAPRTITVPCTTIDAYVEGLPVSQRRIDLIKMDLQGAEFSVMKGARKTLSTLRPIVIFEFWPIGLRSVKEDPTDFLRFMRDCGYALEVLNPHCKMSDASDAKITLMNIENSFTGKHPFHRSVEILAVPKERYPLQR